MQIQCPHCGHTFESTGLEVHFCPNCGQKVDLAQPAPGAAAPTPGSPEFSAGPTRTGGQMWGAPQVPVEEPTPWERRQELGLFQAYWQTWKKAVLSPDKFWPSVPPNGSLWDALLFAWISTGISFLLSLPFQWLNLSSSLPNLLNQMHLPESTRAMLMNFMSGRGLLCLAVGGLMLYPLFLFISAGIIHLFAMLFGTAQNGFNATGRALYGTAPQLLAWLPCVGFAAALYSLVLYIWGLATLQRSSPWRAAGAVLTALVLVCCCISLAIGGAIAVAMGNR